jgi:hypothetical protein
MRKLYRTTPKNIHLHEDEFDDEDEYIASDIVNDIERDVDEELSIEDTLYEIGDNMGFDFITYNGRGSYSISDNVEIDVRYTKDKVTAIDTKIIKNPAKFSCIRNTTTIDNLSVELQTCVMIIKEIKTKLKV